MLNFENFFRDKMAVPLLSKKIVKKRVKKFKRPQSDRKISVKVCVSILVPLELVSLRISFWKPTSKIFGCVFKKFRLPLLFFSMMYLARKF